MIMNINMVTNVLKEQHEQQHEEEQLPKEIDIYSEMECDQCKKKITDNEGLFVKEKDGYKVFYFDSYYCKSLFKKRLDNKIIKGLRIQNRLKKCESTNCNKVFDPLYNKKRRYCSKQCAYENHPSYYDMYYWCEMCNEWILKVDSILVPKGSVNQYGNYKTKRDKYLCPQCKNKVRTTPSYSTKHDKKKKKEEAMRKQIINNINNATKNKKVVLTV